MGNVLKKITALLILVFGLSLVYKFVPLKILSGSSNPKPKDVKINLEKKPAHSLIQVFNGINCTHNKTNLSTITSYHCVNSYAKTLFDAPYDLENQLEIELSKPVLGESILTVTNNNKELNMNSNIVEVGECSAKFVINQFKSNLTNGTIGVLYYVIQGDSGAAMQQKINNQNQIVGVFWKTKPNLPSVGKRARSTDGTIVFKGCKK